MGNILKLINIYYTKIIFIDFEKHLIKQNY